MFFRYVDSDLNISGTEKDSGDDWEETMVYSLVLKKGWNVVYYTGSVTEKGGKEVYQGEIRTNPSIGGMKWFGVARGEPSEPQTADFSITITNNSNDVINGIIIGDHTGGANPYVPHYIRVPINNIAPAQTSEVLGPFTVGNNYGGGYFQIGVYVRLQNGSWDRLEDFVSNHIWDYSHTGTPPPNFIALSYPRNSGVKKAMARKMLLSLKQ